MLKLLKKKIQLKWYWVPILGLVFSVGILLFTLFIQIGPFTGTVRIQLQQPVLLMLNLLPILLTIALFYFLFGNLFYAAGIASVIFELLSLVNLIKMEGRRDPLVPADFSLLSEAVEAAGSYSLNLHPLYIAGIAGLALILILLGVKLKTPRPKPLLRAGGALLACGVFVLSMATVYPDQALYKKMISKVPKLSSSNVPQVFDQLGFPYCFLHNFRLYEIDRPADYSREEAAAWAAGGTTPEMHKAHVIFIQCEAFTDITRSEAFVWDEETDPLRDYDLVAESPQAISGHVVVSNFGAGTANTEFDVLTGMQTNMISEGNVSSLRVIHKNVNSLARVFAAQGYQPYFMHPGYSWFYNRDSVYDYFGFPERVFEDDFVSPKILNSRISDESFRVRLLADFQKHTAASDAPFFGFTVTIQNHQAYHYYNYPNVPMPPVQVNRPLSDSSMEQLTVYSRGVRDSSRMLRELTETCDEMDEPLLLVFWGDHLPALGSNYAAYRELGIAVGEDRSFEETVSTYATPFVIWANRAYCETCDFSAARAALELDEHPRISDIYLGSLVYDLLHMDGADPYFDFLREARHSLQVLCKGVYQLPDGSLTDELTPEQAALVRKLHCWEYYRLVDERITGS